MQTFPEALAEILKRRKMSASVAAAGLGYSSKTALLRILNGESKPSSYKKCYDAAESSDFLALTQEERAQLERALQVSTFGKKLFIVNSLLQKLLYPPVIEDSPANQAIEGLEGILTIEELLGCVTDLSDVSIQIFGKCEIPLIHRFSRLAEHESIKGIEQIIAVRAEDPEDYRTVGDSSHIIFSPKYSLYTYTSRKDDLNNWSFHSGIIYITGESAGKRHLYMLTPMNSECYFCIHETDSSLIRLRDRIIMQAKENIQPIKTSRTYMNDPFPLNYIQFIDEYRHIEHNREILTIKPDLPFFCIPPDLLFPIVLNAFTSVSALEEGDAAMNRLYSIQKSRYDNLFEKNKDTHIILSREAMEHFARTGKREDHFFLIRPYTPQERVVILHTLLEKMYTCPHFHIWYIRNTSIKLNKEITSYENFGLAIVNSGTSWNISSDHQEILLESKLVSSCFSDYFLNHILQDDVYSFKESIEIMKELIAIAENAQ